LSQNNREESARVAKRTIASYSAMAGLLVALTVGLAWYVLDVRERTLIDRVSAATARSIEGLISKDIEYRITLLTELAQRWEGEIGISRTDWESMVKRLFRAQPGYETIAWIDTSMQLSWVVNIDNSDYGLDANLRSRPTSLIAAKSALDQEIVAFTGPLDTVSGIKSLEIYSPVYRPTPNGSVSDGLLLSILLIDPFLDSILPLALVAEHDLDISINDEVLFSTNSGAVLADRRWVQHRRFDINGLKWQLDIVPKDVIFFANYSRFSTFMLMLLILLSGLTASSSYFMLTSRRRDKQIRDSSTHLERLFRNISGMAYRCHQHYPWPMEFVSEGCQELCGYESSTLETQQVLWGKLIHPDDRDRVKISINEALADCRQFNIQYRLQTRTGAERWVWDQGVKTSETGAQEFMVEGFITDITDQKLAELALIEERAYSEAVVDTAVEAIITIDASGCIDVFNRSAEEMFGYPQDLIRGENVSVLMPQPHRDKHNGYIHSFIDTGEAQILNKGRELNAIRKDGSVFPIHLSISEVYAQEKQMFVGLIRDISQQREAEQVARQQRERLAHVERLNTLGEMATGIAHEINQPLTAISLFSQAGKRMLNTGKDEKFPEIFDKLSLHAQRAGAIIERIQMMTRQHKSVIEIEECNKLVKEAVTLAETDARVRDIVIDMKQAKELPLVYVDRVQIQQVVLNLLRNGMEAMQSVNCKYGDTILLQTRLNEAGDVEVVVNDCGSGISDEDSKDVFTPFSTSKEKGMGMGLSISRTIIVAHGGQLAFYNNKSCGVTFYFTLPAAKKGVQNAL
jgi:two-component system sensor kinase FixL